MVASKVFFSNLRTSPKENLPAKLRRLLDSAGLERVIAPGNLTAIKLHFGEKGNTAFVPPLLIRCVIDRVKELGSHPFLTDTNTLYAGARRNSVSHIHTAIQNGFAYSVMNAPIVIADGIRGASFTRVKVDEEIIKTAYVGKDIVEADALVSAAHFKGHELTGFAGTLKNLGMGCAARQGKLDQHSDLSPKVKRKKCVGCGECLARCPQNAIAFREDKAFIDPGKCIGCGGCIAICSNDAVRVRWNADIPALQKKMTEYALASLKGKEERAFFLNFLTNISPTCDCCSHSDAPIVRDLGIMASCDPVALDQASVEMVNSQPLLWGSLLAECGGRGDDKFRELYPEVDWTIQLEHAQKIGLGSRQYELVCI